MEESKRKLEERRKNRRPWKTGVREKGREPEEDNVKERSRVSDIKR